MRDGPSYGRASRTTLGTSILQPLRTLLEKPTPNYDVNVTPVPAAVDKRTLGFDLRPSFLLRSSLPADRPRSARAAPRPILMAWPWVGMSMIFTTMTQVSHVQEQTQPSGDAEDGSQLLDEPADLDVFGLSMGEHVTGASRLESIGRHRAVCRPQRAVAPSRDAARRLRRTSSDLREKRPSARSTESRIRSSRHFGTAVNEMLQYMFVNNSPERRAELSKEMSEEFSSRNLQDSHQKRVRSPITPRHATRDNSPAEASAALSRKRRSDVGGSSPAGVPTR